MSEYKEHESADVIVEQNSWENALNNEPVISPVVDIYETQEEFVLVANLPGVSKENVHLKFEKGSLSIFGKVNYNDSLKKSYILNESMFANYFRNFRLSESIDNTKIEAKYENAQLVVTLPKHEKVKPRIININ